MYDNDWHTRACLQLPHLSNGVISLPNRFHVTYSFSSENFYWENMSAKESGCSLGLKWGVILWCSRLCPYSGNQNLVLENLRNKNLVLEILRNENLEVEIFLKSGAPKSGVRDFAARKLSARNFAEPRFGDWNSGTRAIFYNFFFSNSFHFQFEQLKFEFSTGLAFALPPFGLSLRCSYFCHLCGAPSYFWRIFPVDS